MRILEAQLADGTKIVWRFKGAIATACLERILKVVKPETLPAEMPVAAEVSVEDAPYTPGLPDGWRMETLIRRHQEFAARRTDLGVEILVYSPETPLPLLIWYGFLPDVLKRKLIVVHGALLVKEEKGIILCGPSGAGKSTSARRVPPPWRALCDDAVLISHTNGCFYAQPLPTWSQFTVGKGFRQVRIGEAVRLSGIYRLRHSDREQLNELPAMERVQILFRQFFDLNHMWQAGRRNDLWYAMNEAVIDFAIDAVREIPVGELECSLTGEFWKELEKVL